MKTKSINYIGFGEETIWAPNSRYIASTHGRMDAGLRTVYVYDTNMNLEKETIIQEKKDFTSYDHIRWASDSASIYADYVTLDDEPYGNLLASGEATIKFK